MNENKNNESAEACKTIDSICENLDNSAKKSAITAAVAVVIILVARSIINGVK